MGGNEQDTVYRGKTCSGQNIDKKKGELEQEIDEKAEMTEEEEKSDEDEKEEKFEKRTKETVEERRESGQG
jgi:hypothetical protein